MSRRLTSFLTGNTALRALAQRGQELAALNRRFHAALPPSLASASRVVGLEQRILTVGADNGAVAAKLRQLAPQILLKIQEDNAQVTGIRVKVQVRGAAAAQRPVRRPARKIDEQAIADLASTLKKSPLKDALLRLIRR